MNLLDSDPVPSRGEVRTWRQRFSRPLRATAARIGGQHAVNAFAQKIDLAKLTPEQFMQVLETLHMLGSTGSGVELSSLSTEVLVDIVSRASREQIKAIADHPELRGVFLDEIFRRMSDQFMEDKARHVNFVVSWRFLDGSGEDGFDRFQTVIEDGVCVSSVDLGRAPDTTITLSVEDFIRMATGNAAVAAMFVTGKVKVKGEYAPAVRFSSYFDIPKPV
ncbi:SCP-2 sterol transfer family protein [Amycolatopsis xylanica]|uniref:SCP-2 sterol transfer family protein n=2 Tax=Pseudonocardiaceae TaxID=2070 RepID=A0A1H3AEY9_9PSEU|nr:SCP-2 sterol transfer family protein [Amycolatopsis xylanica]